MLALPDDSLTVALASGGREFYGWGGNRHLLADLYDAINQNTRASGRWGKKGAPKFSPYPRPSTDQSNPEKRKKVSVAQIYGLFHKQKG